MPHTLLAFSWLLQITEKEKVKEVDISFGSWFQGFQFTKELSGVHGRAELFTWQPGKYQNRMPVLIDFILCPLIPQQPQIIGPWQLNSGLPFSP